MDKKRNEPPILQHYTLKQCPHHGCSYCIAVAAAAAENSYFLVQVLNDAVYLIKGSYIVITWGQINSCHIGMRTLCFYLNASACQVQQTVSSCSLIEKSYRNNVLKFFKNQNIFIIGSNAWAMLMLLLDC